MPSLNATSYWNLFFFFTFPNLYKQTLIRSFPRKRVTTNESIEMFNWRGNESQRLQTNQNEAAKQAPSDRSCHGRRSLNDVLTCRLKAARGVFDLEMSEVWNFYRPKNESLASFTPPDCRQLCSPAAAHYAVEEILHRPGVQLRLRRDIFHQQGGCWGWEMFDFLLMETARACNFTPG